MRLDARALRGYLTQCKAVRPHVLVKDYECTLIMAGLPEPAKKMIASALFVMLQAQTVLNPWKTSLLASHALRHAQPGRLWIAGTSSEHLQQEWIHAAHKNPGNLALQL